MRGAGAIAKCWWRCRGWEVTPAEWFGAVPEFSF